MMTNARANAICRLRRGLSRGRGWAVAAFVFAAAMLWSQAYVPFHMLSAHGHAAGHGHEHAEAQQVVAPVVGYIVASGPAADAVEPASHDHGNGHAHKAGYQQDAGAQHDHGRADVPVDGDGRAPERPRHDHSILDHAFALEAAVHPHVLALAPAERIALPEAEYLAEAVAGLAPTASSRGPPAA